MRPEAAAQVLNCWQAAGDPMRSSTDRLICSGFLAAATAGIAGTGGTGRGDWIIDHI
jgi:hypothetical protein